MNEFIFDEKDILKIKNEEIVLKNTLKERLNNFGYKIAFFVSEFVSLGILCIAILSMEFKYIFIGILIFIVFNVFQFKENSYEIIFKEKLFYIKKGFTNIVIPLNRINQCYIVNYDNHAEGHNYEKLIIQYNTPNNKVRKISVKISEKFYSSESLITNRDTYMPAKHAFNILGHFITRKDIYLGRCFEGEFENIYPSNTIQKFPTINEINIQETIKMDNFGRVIAMKYNDKVYTRHDSLLKNELEKYKNVLNKNNCSYIFLENLKYSDCLDLWIQN